MDEAPARTVQDLAHLRRCVDLAREAPADGDQAFHCELELELARWAAADVAS